MYGKYHFDEVGVVIFSESRKNGSGQNGTDKVVWTKWYTDNLVLDKMVRTKRDEQNGIYKMGRTKWYS